MKKFLQTSFKLGSKEFSSNVFYAPLAGCSDYPFRCMSALYSPGLMYPEMVKMDALIRNDTGTFHILDYSPEMHPIGGQICGSNPKIAGQAAKIIEELGFDVVDLNCGCPVDKVTKDGSGSGMLKTPERIGEVLANMVAAVKIPVTVKIRAGWDEESIIGPLVTEIAEKAGAKAICIHGRTRAQAYKGPANWDYIKMCKAVAKEIKVIGNGDLFTPEAVEKCFEHTGCDAVLISRGTLGNPWIVEDIIAHLSGQPRKKRSFEDKREALLQHFHFVSKYHCARKTLVEMRRVGCWYIKRSEGTKAFRDQMSHAESVEEVRDLIMHFPFPEEEEGEAELPTEC